MTRLPIAIILYGSISGLGPATAAGAQTAGTTPSVTTAEPAPGDVVPASGKLDDIVVTAQRRQQSLQSVPIAISTVSAATAKAIGITDVTSIQAIAPGLEFPRYFSGATPALRGVGTNVGVGAQESVVALYVDDVYIASPAATTFSLNNIEQVAVLKGPQGTLFGRNAMGGVIQITTRDPSRSFKLDASSGYANYDTVSGSLYATGGITDAIAADIALTGSHQGAGWGKNLATGADAFREKSWAARSKWVWRLSNTTVTLAADFTRDIYNAGIAMRPVKGALFPNGQVYEGYYNVRELPEGQVDTKQGGVSLKVEHKLGFADLTNIIAWRKVKSHNIADEDQTTAFSQDFVYDDDRETVSEEVHLASPRSSSNFTWIAGLFYLNDRPTTLFTVRGLAIAPLPSVVQDVRSRNQSYAAFGQATLTVAESWHLTAGLRYTRDEIQFNGITNTPELNLLIDSGKQNAHFSKATYKASVQKTFTPDVMAYLSYSTGYKSGIYNISDYHAPPVRPESLDALEGGLKTELFNKRLRVNLTGFYYWYKNLQVSTLVNVQGRTLQALQNAASVRNKGVEIETEARPLPHLTLRGALAYMHSRFTSFPNATLSVPLASGGNATVSGSAAGLKTPHAPDFTSDIGAYYELPTTIGSFLLSTNYDYDGGFVWDADNRLKQHPYHLINSSISWTPTSRKFDVQLWVKNLASQRYSVYTTANIVGDEETPAAPRTYGLTIGVHL